MTTSLSQCCRRTDFTHETTVARISDHHVSSELCVESFVSGESKKAERMLEQVEEPHLLKDDEYGGTLLYWAAYWGWSERVKQLIEHYQCDPQVSSNNGSTCLHSACFCSGNLDVVSYLIEKYKCDSMKCDDDGWTPLHLACAGGHINVAKYLIAYCKCDPMCRENSGWTPLHSVCGNSGNLDVACFLIEECKCDPMCEENNGYTPLHLVCWNSGNLDVIHYLIEECECDAMCNSIDGWTPLHSACAGGHVNVARYLITQCNSDPTSKDNDGWTPLHDACAGGHVNVLKYLIAQCKCDPMCKGNNGWTPLHSVCGSSGSLDVVCYLIEVCKCDVMYKNNFGRTPLHLACAGGHVNVAKYLITQCGCDSMCKSNDGWTPLHSVCENSGNLDVIRYLIEETKCDAMCKNNDGQTPLHSACIGGHINVVEYLIIQCECDSMCKSNDGSTPLHSACQSSGSLDLVCYLIEECKCDPMCKNNDGWTPLHSACVGGHLNVVKYLITECNCDPVCTNKLFRTPLNEACANAHYLVAEYLLCAGSWNILPMSPRFSGEDSTVKVLLKKFSKIKQCLHIDSYTNVFLLGDSGVGKTTLAEVIKQRTKGVVLGHLRHVSTVELHTAGIIPHRLEHRELGNIILHDLAGQPEYYSSHIAVLENIIQGAAAVFIIVVKLSEDAPYRWLSTVKDLSSRCSSVCYVLTVASHKDTVEKRMRCQLKQDLEGKILSCLMGKDRLQSMGIVYLDCRKLQSNHFTVFKDSLSAACQSVQSNLNHKDVQSQDIMYCRMLYLLMDHKGDHVYAFNTLWKMVRESNDYYLPEAEDKLSETLHYLHCIGLIMLINTPGGSWIVFRKRVLLTEVNGKIFAPETFKSFKNVTSNTGIVSKKALCQHFPHYDPEMLVKFLTSMKLCGKITPEMMEMTNLSPKDSDDPENELLFFPALMCYNRRPVMSKITSNEPFEDDATVIDEPFQFGWCLHCMDEHSSFSSRFLHLLILCLAYQYSLPESSLKPHDLRCTIWSTGILWNNEYGVKTLVELVDNNQSIILLMSSKEGLEHNMIPLRRMVITDVLFINRKTCPSVQAMEYIIDSSQLDYPIDKPCSLILYDIAGIASCIALNQPCVVSCNMNTQRQHINKKLCDLLPLEYDRGQDMSIFTGRDIEVLKMPGGRKIPSTILSSPADVLKKHSAAIKESVSDPERLANNLYSVGLISDGVKDEVGTTIGLPRYKKVSIVINDVERNMSGTNMVEMFNTMCEILKKDCNETVREIVIEMEREVGISHDQ